MKHIKNDSLQGFILYLSSPKGSNSYWLKPGQSIVVPDSALSEQVKTLHKRRLLKISAA
jgi:hypothetical protein